jgi:hypothetical protein
MAMPRTWLPRAEEILDVLRRMKSKQLDRAAIEELFQLQRRAAIELMTQAGATGKRGSAFLVDRTSLLSWTERVFKDESWQLQRHQETSAELSRSMAEVRALREKMAREGRQPLGFPIDEESFRTNCNSLPPAIRIEHGRITIEISDAPPDEMLTTTCQLLYELAMALNNDPDSFRDRLTAGELAPELTRAHDLLAALQHKG